MVPPIKHANNFYCKMVFCAVASVVGSIALTIIVAKAGNFSAAYSQKAASVVNNCTLAIAGFVGFCVFCVLEVLRKRSIKQHEDRQIQLRTQLHNEISDYFAVKPCEARTKVHPLSLAPANVVSLVCQYASLLEGNEIRKEFGLVEKDARNALCVAWTERFDNLETLNAFIKLSIDVATLKDYAIEGLKDGLDHIENPFMRVLHWERVDIQAKCKIIAKIGPNEINAAIGLVFYCHGQVDRSLVSPTTFTRAIEAIARSESPKLVKMALDRFPSEDLAKVDAGPIFGGVIYKSEKIALLLLEKGVKPRNKDDYNLYAIIEFGHTQLLQRILEIEGHLNHLDNEFFLHKAINGAIIKKDLGARSVKTLYHDSDFVGMVRLLVRLGVNKNLRSNGLTPLELAEQHQLSDIIPLLKD